MGKNDVMIGDYPLDDGNEREVVILMSDMVGYSAKTARMRPKEVRDFAVTYHETMREIVNSPAFQPVEIEPVAGDGAICVFDRRPGEEDREEVCIRALRAALALSSAIEQDRWPATRMGLFSGDMVEAWLGERKLKFGAGFAVATRLEELCDFFGTTFLMDKDVALSQNKESFYLVSVGKINLKSFAEPLQVYTIYKPGLHNIPLDVDKEQLFDFISRKNKAMVHFGGISTAPVNPDFPKVRQELVEAQSLFRAMTGAEDLSTERILEYIRENPIPDKDFAYLGMCLADKKRSTLGASLFHLSSELLRAINDEFYHALVEDTSWERFFHLEWRTAGETIITIHAVPDGVYFLDHGEVLTLNDDGEEIAVLHPGTIFGEMAYFSDEKRRTATIVAKTDVVIRRIAGDDLERIPVIKRIFEQIALTRR